MTDVQTPLSGFEKRLLAELRSEVETSDKDGAVAAIAPHRPRRRRIVLTVAAALAIGTGAAVGVPLVTGSDAPAQAFTVERSPDGAVTATIYRFSDAAGLEQQLADYGVHAVVHYAPPGKMCAPTPALHYVDLPASALRFENSASGALSVTVSPAQLSGLTLFILTMDDTVSVFDEAGHVVPGVAGSEHGLGAGVTDGPVPPCVLIDKHRPSPALPSN